MKKNFLLVATVVVAMVSCTNDTDLSGGKSIAQQTTDGSIAFNMNTPATTRATGADAASKLNNMFIVWGEKNETSGIKANAKDVVFKNYVVKHDKTGEGATSNYGANTTTSNTNGWEYVGIDHSDFNTNVTPNITSSNAQTIKYWDDQASSYTFTAVSALQSDIKEGKVIIAKNVGTDTEDKSKTVYDKGYTIQVKEGASTDDIYYADRNNIAKGTTGYDHSVVELTFRNFKSKIRFGIFETVPGYKVVITGIKYNSNVQTPTISTSTSGASSSAGTFGIDGEFIVPGDKTKYTVTYENNTIAANENKVKATIATGDKNTEAYFEQGTTWLSTSASSPVGTAANNPTWNDTDGNYKTILPNPQNETNLKLQVAYKLVSEDTNEEIVFKTGTGESATETYRTVEIPYEYCKWKPNYAYTYLFKITDKSAGLNPITFDACVVENQTGNQETITTVGAPYITTIAQTSTSDKTIVTEGNEYTAGNVIYATVVEDNQVVSLTKNSNIDLYTVTTTDATNFPITEASVAHAIEVSTESGVTKKITATAETLNDNDIVTAVPTEDGSTVDLPNSGKALKWTAAANTVYAVVYTKTDANDTSKKTYTCKIVRIGTIQATQATGENMVWKNLQ